MEKGGRVDAIDIAEGAIAIAKDYYDKLQEKSPKKNKKRIRYICHDLNYIEKVKLRDSYDIIYIRGTLHHLPMADKVLEYLPNLMDDDSLLIIDDTADQFRFQAPLNAHLSPFLEKYWETSSTPNDGLEFQSL